MDYKKIMEEIYQEIAETLGIAALRLGYCPDGMVLDSYMIMENTGWAYVNYLYEGETITIQMVKDYKETCVFFAALAAIFSFVSCGNADESRCRRFSNNLHFIEWNIRCFLCMM